MSKNRALALGLMALSGPILLAGGLQNQLLPYLYPLGALLFCAGGSWLFLQEWRKET
ncbi:hypothetical protein ACFO4L_01205 [Bacillus daqingensis]|uniref:Uncharacterized protein n=1 Tax=Bacillus daqingensis TaxID=872396 RepID=A0ABV9NP98_9BACI